PSDFERWTEKYNIKGFSWDDVLPYYKKMESTSIEDATWHGNTGPFVIHQMTKDEISPMQQLFIQASKALGYQEISDFNAN
ncbi:GMC family oxidoreductase N-terminal domain-containing protein, partial [Staphylococcus aureus]|uniref:GMC family oxidoreductase N-terminal domain-containing protein n=1 Tax=Staphylococcus aureus TaxID=1280 RepID=UPI0021B09D7C